MAPADAPGGASFGIGGYAAMSVTVCGAGTDVELVPAQATATDIVKASSAARATTGRTSFRAREAV